MFRKSIPGNFLQQFNFLRYFYLILLLIDTKLHESFLNYFPLKMRISVQLNNLIYSVNPLLHKVLKSHTQILAKKFE